jgi:hypothetical protein
MTTHWVGRPWTRGCMASKLWVHVGEMGAKNALQSRGHLTLS